MLELTSSSSSVGSRGAAVGGCSWDAGYVPVRAVGVVAPCTAYLGPGRNSAYWTLCTYQLNDDFVLPPPSSTDHDRDCDNDDDEYVNNNVRWENTCDSVIRFLTSSTVRGDKNDQLQFWKLSTITSLFVGVECLITSTTSPSNSNRNTTGMKISSPRGSDPIWLLPLPRLHSKTVHTNKVLLLWSQCVGRLSGGTFTAVLHCRGGYWLISCRSGCGCRRRWLLRSGCQPSYLSRVTYNERRRQRPTSSVPKHTYGC